MATFEERFGALGELRHRPTTAEKLALLKRYTTTADPTETSYDPMTGLPIGAPHTAAPSRQNWFMEPDLTGYQTGKVDLPPGAERDENGFYYPDTGERLSMVRRPGVLPFAKTPDGYTMAMPKLLDVASNIVGGSVPLKGGEIAFGAGAIRPKRSTEIPSIRGLPVDEGIAIARKEPHLIKAGDQSEGFYVGGPRDITSRRSLTNKRKEFDEYVASDPRGGDWYDRYRGSVV